MNVKCYRKFRDHAGRLHRVEMNRDEIRERVVYWASIPFVAIGMLIVMSFAAGIII